jgi:hypothetical protein
MTLFMSNFSDFRVRVVKCDINVSIQCSGTLVNTYIGLITTGMSSKDYEIGVCRPQWRSVTFCRASLFFTVQLKHKR